MTVPTEVAVIGLGSMDREMAHRLVISGFDVVVVNRTLRRLDHGQE